MTRLNIIGRRLGRSMLAATALAGSIALFGSTAGAATDTSQVTAQVSAVIGITNSDSLRFGKFLPSGVAGTVVISAVGVRSQTGGVTLIVSDPGGASGFAVTGEPATTYAITLPAGPIALTSAANTMNIGTFTDSETGIGTLDGTGNDTFTVGATLTVDVNQPLGTYSGQFDVTVEYN